MQANKFLEKNKWLLDNNAVELKEIISEAADYKYFCISDQLGFSYSNHTAMGASVSIDDLKRLVESWELVEGLGGLVKAKINLSSVEYNLSKSVWFGEDKLEKENFASRLRQAIADVESCQ